MGANNEAPIFLLLILLNHSTEISKLESLTQNPDQSPRSCLFLTPHKTQCNIMKALSQVWQEAESQRM